MSDKEDDERQAVIAHLMSPGVPLNSSIGAGDEFVGSIDCGTTSSRFYVFDKFGQVRAFHQLEYQQIYPAPGWHEHDPFAYLMTIDECIAVALSKLAFAGYAKSTIKTVGITSQRETLILWDRKTGLPLRNSIVWADQRNLGTIAELKERAEKTTFYTKAGPMKGEQGIKELTGLPINAYFSATKYAWLIENDADVIRAKKDKTLMMGTLDSWLLYCFTGGAFNGIHVTDVANASRTLLLNVDTLQWDPQLLEFFDIHISALPTLVSNSQHLGEFKPGHILEGTPIAGVIGDQQGSLVGNMCFKRGQAKQTYGTGLFMLYNTGNEFVRSKHGLMSTVAYQAGPNAPATFAIEGSVAVGGSSIQWLRDNLGLIEDARDAGPLAEEVPDTGGVYFVTSLSGLFAPYWDPLARGTIVGMSSFTTKHHIIRATLEATCFQTRAILDAMAKDTVGEVSVPDPAESKIDWASLYGMKALRVDGGMTASDTMMQIQADVLGIPVVRPLMRESTALGAALLAGSAMRLFGWNLEDTSTLKDVNNAGTTVFVPTIDDNAREYMYGGWNRAVVRAQKWLLPYDGDSEEEEE